MNYKVLAFVVCVMPFACSAHDQKIVDTSFVPDKNNRAYTVMVEAGAKLLEFDIIRARVNAQEKALVATLQHETFTSTAGKALGVLGPLEQLAHGFDDVIPAFLILQNSVTESATTDSGKTQISQALNGLVALLAEPEVLHAVLPQPELVGAQYRDAMTYAPTATFVKTIQAIAHKKFMLHYCSEDQQLVGQQVLPNDAHLFYGVIRQTVQNLFGEMMKVVVATPVNAQQAKICSTVYFEDIKLHDFCLEFIEIKKRFAETKNSGEYSTSIAALIKKRKDACQVVATKLGAGSVVANNYPLYVDPACDITQEVIEVINKEYLASKQNDASVKPEQQKSSTIEVVKPVVINAQAKIEVIEPIKAVKPNLSPQEMLYQAILHDSAEKIEVKNQRALVALSEKNYSTFEELIKQGARVNMPYHEYLHKAIESNDIDLALLLLKNGADFLGKMPTEQLLDFPHSIMSHILLRIGHGYISRQKGLDFIDELIRRGYNINGDTYSTNALFLLFFPIYGIRLSDQDFIEVLNFFIQHGANTKKIVINDPIDDATRKTSFDYVAQGTSWTPLFGAILYGRTKSVLALLLEAGADLNQKALSPHAKISFNITAPVTPLQFAELMGRQEIVDFLIEQGAGL